MAELDTEARDDYATVRSLHRSRGRAAPAIHDAAHVRNAIARFDQTDFESKSAGMRRRRESSPPQAPRHRSTGILSRQGGALLTHDDAFPAEGMELTHILVVADIGHLERSTWDVLGAEVFREYGGSSWCTSVWDLAASRDSGGPTRDKRP